MKKLTMGKNPALFIALIFAVVGVGTAFGLVLTGKQIGAIVAAVWALLALLQGLYTRANVYSPASVNRNAVAALEATGPNETFTPDPDDNGDYIAGHAAGRADALADVPPDVPVEPDVPQDAPVHDALVEQQTDPIAVNMPVLSSAVPAPVEAAAAGPTDEQLQSALGVGVQAALAHLAAN